MKLKFGKISEIDIHDDSSWIDKIFITLDIDWAPDHIIREVHAILKTANVCSTWFVTHDSPAISELQDDPSIELGIHPNFNPLLLQGSHEKGISAEHVLDDMIKQLPKATSIRSHSLTQNSALLNIIKAKNFIYDCNLFLPYNSGINVRPFLHWNGLVRVPHIWEDDVAPIYNDNLNQTFEQIVSYKGLKVLGFHPIHIYLNTDQLDNYNSIKHDMNDIDLINRNINRSTMGTNDFLNKFLEI